MPNYDVVHGDAFDALSELPDDYGHAAVVDYPWKFVNGKRPGRASHTNPEDWDMQDNFRLGHALGEISRVVSPGGYVFVFADDDVLPQFRKASEKHLEYRKTLIWDTERIGNGHYFRSRHGYIICATIGDTDRHVTKRPTVLEAPAPQREPGKTTEYPTEKPIRLYRLLLESPVLRDGERLLEPFCGSGPGAAVTAGRGLDYWGCDSDDNAIELTRDHFNQNRIHDLP